VGFDAVKHAKDAVALAPESGKAHYRLAMAYKLNNDLEPSKEHLTEAIKIEPNNAQLR
jgi:Tfp pilus assembly protein PilF